MPSIIGRRDGKYAWSRFIGIESLIISFFVKGAGEDLKVFLIGIDVGTSSTKAMVVSPEGRTVCIAQERYGIVSRRANWSEQDPEIWWQAVKTALRHAIAKTRQQFAGDRIEFAAIGLSGQMHGLVLLDAHGCVLRPSIIWADQRTAQDAAAFYQAAGRDRIAGITANAVVPGFLGPSLLRVKRRSRTFISRSGPCFFQKTISGFG